MHTNHSSPTKSYFMGFCLILSFLFLGYFIYKGLKTFSDKDRYVTVKGLAEMDIEATASQINIAFNFSGDDLNSLIAQTEKKKNDILALLERQGYSTNTIEQKNVNIQDKQTYYENDWVDGKQVKVKVDRYTVTQKLVIKRANVKQTKDEADKLNLELIHNNLTSSVTTQYSFPDLNTIKPQLIAESTQNARIAGEQFANDSNAKLGKIKTASQGQISLAGTYHYDEEVSNTQPTEEYIQRARVVSTIVFFLE